MTEKDANSCPWVKGNLHLHAAYGAEEMRKPGR